MAGVAPVFTLIIIGAACKIRLSGELTHPRRHGGRKTVGGIFMFFIAAPPASFFLLFKKFAAIFPVCAGF